MAGTSQQLDEAQQTLLGAVEAATAMKIVKMDVLVRNETLVRRSVGTVYSSRLTLSLLGGEGRV